MLFRSKGGEGRVPAVEILRFTGAVRDAIQRAEGQEALKSLMEEGRQTYGMQTFDQHLMELVQEDLVDYGTAKEAATSPSDFELVMQTLSGGEGDEGPDPDDMGGIQRGSF